MTGHPPPLGTVVPTVRYQVINHHTMRWETVARGPETPRTEAIARQAAGRSMLWIYEDGVRRPVT